jgi:hypothetical protein
MFQRYLRVVIVFFVLFSSAEARDDRKKFSIKDAYDTQKIEPQLGKIKLYFEGEAHPRVTQNLGLIRTNRKTNSFNKSDLFACQWVFYSALLALRDRAVSNGGDAVINIKSNYKNLEFSSATEFECGVGRIIAGVALTGEVVKTSGGVTSASTKNSSSVSGDSCSEKKIADMKNIGMTEQQIKQACAQKSNISAYDAVLVKKAQIALNNRGYDAGVADGMWGNRSRLAMKMFQEKSAINITGELNDESISALGINGI